MKEIRKSTFREIRSSFGRFMAIFAIIALGVGFFSGLKVTREAMVTSVEGYLEERGFYDFRLLSTLGFEQEDVEFLREQSDAAVEGAVSIDVLYQLEEGTQGVVKTYSLPEQINTVELVAGRMPEKSNECVADSKLFGEEDLGSVIYLSEDNEEDTLDDFSHTAYTVVGLVQSPLYIQYERGNTSLGTGQINGFLYLPSAGFSVDYYTDIYVRFDQDSELYSDAYEAFIEEKTENWEALTQTAADRRYRSVVEEAEKELADAKAELADKKKEGEEELADAAAELADAEAELADGERALADAKTELADADKTLADKTQELTDAKDTLAQKKQEFADAEQKLNDSIAEWEKNDNAVEDGKRQLREGYAALNEQKTPLLEQEKALLEQEAQLKEQEAQLEEQRTQLEEQRTQLQTQREQLQAGIDQLTQAIAALALTGGDTTELEAQREELQATLARAEQASAGLQEGLTQVQEGLAQLRSGLAGLQEGLAELQGGLAKLQSAEAQLKAAEEEVQAGDKKLSEIWWNQLLPAKEELEKGREELSSAEGEIADGEQALADAGAELSDARETLAEKEQELADAQAEYQDGKREYEDALREFEEKIAEAEEELADAGEKVSEIEEPKTYVLGRDTNIGYVCFESDSAIVDGIANIFPVFFFLVAALVCITTMNRMVEEQRTQIGVLKALGYGEGIIMSKYVIYSGLAAVTGCIFGFFLGTWLFPKVIWYVYGMMYTADALAYVFSWKLAFLSLTVALLCSVGTTWLSCRVELSEAASELMRPKAPKAGKRVLLEYLPFLWKHLSFLRKVSLRNIFRYKKRLFMMVVGISGCTALLVTGFGVKDSIADVAERQFTEIQIFDIEVDLKEPADEAFAGKLSGLTDSGLEAYLCVMEKSMELVTDKAVKTVCLVAGEPEQMAQFVNLHTESGEAIAYPGQGEAIISNRLAEEYGIRTGDRITLRDENRETVSLTVTAVQENYINNYVYISEKTWESQRGEEPERKKAYVNLSADADAHALSAALMQFEKVSGVTVNADTRERVDNMMSSLDVIVLVIILCAAGLAFVVLYNLTNINITERIREIATIKVLGFYKKETASYVFRENILLTVLGMLLGFVLGHFLHLFVMSEIKIDLITFQAYVKPVSYLYSGLFTLLFAWLVNLAMGRKLEGISMTESLKSVD